MAVNLSPVGGVAGQFFDNNGDPLVGGKLYTYAAGTTTPQATYTSSSGATANSNPIILNAGGRVPAEIWLTDGLIYKFVLYSSTDQLIGSWDNIVGINSNFVNFVTSEEVQTATAGQTVFTLTTMQYQPGINNLVVYVDGVNQVEGGSYSFVETNSTTVTFTSGLHLGAVVKFVSAETVTTIGSNAAQVAYEPAGSGAVTTTVQAKLRETVSVKDFGAVGDGVTDDTAAIQAAIDAATEIHLLSGKTYIVSSKLTFSVAKRIIGHGATIKIKDGASYDSIFYGNGVSGVTLIDSIVFDGNKSNVLAGTGNSLIFFAYFTEIKITNCTISNGLKGGVICSYGDKLVVSKNKFLSLDLSGVESSNISKEVLFTENYVYETVNAGLAYNVNTASNTNRVIISNNVIDDVAYSTYLESGLGITVNVNDTSTMSDVVISGNVVTNAESMGYSLTLANTSADARMSVTGNVASNIGVGSSNTTGIGLEISGKNITVVGNVIKNADAVGISGFNLENCVISGNTVDTDITQTGGNASAGIRLSVTAFGSSNKNVTITGNAVTSSSASTVPGAGIVVYGVSPNGLNDAAAYSDIVISNNTVIGNFIFGVATLQFIDKLVVSNNSIDTSTSLSSDGRALIISGNRVNCTGNITRPKFGAIDLQVLGYSGNDFIKIADNTIHHPYFLVAGVSFNSGVGGVSLQNNTMLSPTGFGSVAISGRANCSSLIESENTWNYAAAAPTVGTYLVGSRVINSAPAVGQPKAWTCTVAGTPGTWTSEGNL